MLAKEVRIMRTLESLDRSSEANSVSKYSLFKACDMMLYGYDDTASYWNSLNILGKGMYFFRMGTFNFRLGYWCFSGNFPEKMKQTLSQI